MCLFLARKPLLFILCRHDTDVNEKWIRTCYLQSVEIERGNE